MRTRKTLVVFLALTLLAISMVACTANQRAKNYGGMMTVNLPPGQKLIIATWKEDALWYLTRQMKPGEEPETYMFREDSSFGIFQGTVMFKEYAK
jgi:K+ transporter